ncbi:hypothetical protein ACFQGW_10310 [Xanthomonas theicola]|uniref:hypothetical protein n=1 Tax=Xanthomonas theicola TaxID=56464 RepID=UPI003612C525
MPRQQRQPIAYLLALGLAFVCGKQADHRWASVVFWPYAAEAGVFSGALKSLLQ